MGISAVILKKKHLVAFFSDMAEFCIIGYFLKPGIIIEPVLF